MFDNTTPNPNNASANGGTLPPVIEIDPSSDPSTDTAQSAIDATILNAAPALNLAVDAAGASGNSRIQALETALMQLLAASQLYRLTVAQPGTHTQEFLEACAVAQAVLEIPHP